jgi:endonuclease/exonuclease/phosphatase family metal-dependent hydrolase
VSTICRKFFAGKSAERQKPRKFQPVKRAFAFGPACRALLVTLLSFGLCAELPNTVRTGSFAPLPAKTRGVWRAVTWNIDRGYDLPKIEAMLGSLEASVIFLQEVDLHSRRTRNADVARDLARSLRYNYAFGPAFQEMSQGVDGHPAYQGQATLCRCAIWNARVLRFKRQSNWWKPHGFIPNTGVFQRRLGGRIALVTELSAGHSMLVAYNVHFESRSAGAIQSAQLNEVLADLKRYPPGTPAIIAGDLNSKYHPAQVLHFLERQGFHSVLGEKIERTHVLIGYFDWIFYRGSWKTESGQVLRGSHASDHDPVAARLRLYSFKN